ncbi:hypothetical protein [Azospirillum sp. SYSU D00513]|uniref:hypothetical protein n=1 Tax=Azospirillum sp. SYSU D00513 TaxID=2812561 RepID=UPI001A96F92E|nr:hypothetical protein [Azospirillum sp. SYSU D00513]
MELSRDLLEQAFEMFGELAGQEGKVIDIAVYPTSRTGFFAGPGFRRAPMPRSRSFWSTETTVQTRVAVGRIAQYLAVRLAAPCPASHS